MFFKGKVKGMNPKSEKVAEELGRLALNVLKKEDASSPEQIHVFINQFQQVIKNYKYEQLNNHQS